MAQLACTFATAHVAPPRQETHHVRLVEAHHLPDHLLVRAKGALARRRPYQDGDADDVRGSPWPVQLLRSHGA